MRTNIAAGTANQSSGKGKLFCSDDQRWEAVLRRDPAADGQFYYAVKTTGVYCRPCCGSKLARRGNIEFHDSCEEAERAGFRPCQRCRPNEPSLHEHYVSVVATACKLIDSSEKPPKLSALAQAVGMSPFHFHRVFRTLTGVSPKAYASARRAERVRASLSRKRSVTEAIYEAGYGSNSRFYEQSSALLGMQPNCFRQGGAGMTIRFAVGECSLGSVLVAASDKGICAILLGDDPNALAKEFQDRFDKAHLIGGDGEFEHVVSRVVGFVERPQSGLDLPLDVRGTAFQRRVWQALREIPFGQTASYAEIAERIGLPSAVRAVGQACGANSIAVAIPCHRVIRSDGKLSGYRWGVERKRMLLAREGLEPPLRPLPLDTGRR